MRLPLAGVILTERLSISETSARELVSRQWYLFRCDDTVRHFVYLRA